eukprot:scaffold631_cov378-Prasinococcus_capsulatus_cf.AAC.4
MPTTLCRKRTSSPRTCRSRTKPVQQTGGQEDEEVGHGAPRATVEGPELVVLVHACLNVQCMAGRAAPLAALVDVHAHIDHLGQRMSNRHAPTQWTQ